MTLAATTGNAKAGAFTLIGSTPIRSALILDGLGLDKKASRMPEFCTVGLLADLESASPFTK